MDYKVIYKDSFLGDLEQILRPIAHENPKAAENLGINILDVAETLRSFPERFPRVRQRPSIRRFVVKRYFKVFYRIRDEGNIVEVLRCWDGRRENDPLIP